MLHIDSFTLDLQARGRSDRTVKMYRDAVAWFAGEHLLTGGEPNAIDTQFTPADKAFRFAPVSDWEQVTRQHVQSWVVRLSRRKHCDGYVNNQYRCLQQFFKWFASEEEVPNPMTKLEPPSIADRPVPVFSEDEIARLFATVKGKDLWSRRDLAILLLLRDTGIRIMELTGLTREDLSLLEREAKVTGKAGKCRTVKFTSETARALDRYLRKRASHRCADRQSLWISPKGTLTSDGIYQMVKRKAAQAGVAGVYPHRFRHHFAHTWLDNGGAEGDLMELNGWDSPQMLRRYGRSAAASRARRGYDRIMGTDR
jgi:integrase/recombinase XerD